MKVLLISLGCDKNLVDSEVMLGMLAEKGYFFTDDETQADVCIVNTCCFIGDAKEESIQNILEMAEYKKTGRLKALIVSGCLAERYREEIQTEIPEVDAVVGTTAIDSIVRAVEETLSGQRRSYYEDVHAPAKLYTGNRIVTGGGYYSYLKIAEGCDKHCTYCVIPKVRGNYRSIPMEILVREAERLAEKGIKELIVVAQETTLYGVDLYGEKRLPELLRRLCRVEGLMWIRVLYCYPEEITDELIQVIKTEEKICHYLDIPIQHASDKVLKQMGRRTSESGIREIIKKLRSQIPDICLRTTLISGFPGETQEDFEILYRFVNEMEFDRLGVFTYSREEDTPAASMPGQIPEKVKISRREELMELQQAVAFEKNECFVGRTMSAMIEGKLAEEDVYLARTYRDAPNVDGLVFIHGDGEYMSGEFVEVKITGFYEYDLTGEICDEFTK